MFLIKLIDVTKKYLNINFNLEINKGDKVLIKGKNGVGKTTLLKLIAGFIKPDSGSIIKKEHIKIKYLEDKFSLPNHLSVESYENMLKSINNCEFNCDIKVMFSISKHTIIKNLSKGNRQKLGILTTLMGDFDIYVLDEPLNGLDNESRELFIDYLNNLRGVTIVVVTHQTNFDQTEFNKYIEL